LKKFSLLFLFGFTAIPLFGQKKLTPPEIGVVQNIENDRLLYKFGFRYLVESAQKMLSPRSVSDRQFQEHLLSIKKLRVPLYACNLFIPGDLKVVGPTIDEEAVLTYVDQVVRRAEAAGIKMLIWGSGGSRGVPGSFNRSEAEEQFIRMAKKIASLAEKQNIILALESLNRTECNFINTIPEALAVVKAVDHKNFRLSVDIYHMLMEGESPEAITGTKDYLVYCEVAEKVGRTPPGVHGEDLVPYFAALRKEGYQGKIVLECRWKDLETQGPAAYRELRSQVDEAYK